MPKFQDMVTWKQAEQLMQPAFIRLIDNLRKQLERSSWKGTYDEDDVWAEGVTDEVKAKVVQLKAQLQTAPADQVAAIEQALAQLPSPYPGYYLHLEQHDHRVTVSLWDLCYQVCFQNYDSGSGVSQLPGSTSSQGVKIDASLFDETGEVDWNHLDRKTQQIVEQIFSTLPESTVED